MDLTNPSQQQQVTEELLLQLTECKTLGEISVLSLRNKQLSNCLKVLSHCPNLNIIYLQNNRIQLYDMQKHLSLFLALQKLDLSFNQIKKLPDAKCFQELRNLKVLYLHENLISQWEDIQNIKSSPAIVHLTLQKNPVCQIPGYRSQMVNQIKSLLALDDYIVTDEERNEYNSPIAIRFRAMSNYMKILIPKFQENKSADQHLFNLEVDLYRVKRLFERNSPSIRIQAFFRGYKVRTNSYYSAGDRNRAAAKIQKVFRGWNFRIKARRDLIKFLKDQGQEELIFSQSQYRKFRATNLLIKAMQKFAKRTRKFKLLQRSALKIQTMWRAKNLKHKAYVQMLGLNQNPCIYFLKEQRIDLQKILRILLQKFPKFKKKYTQEKLKGFIEPCSDYNIIRYPNPLIFKKEIIPILQYVRPSVFSKVKLNQGTCKLIRDGKSITNTYLRFRGMQKEKDLISETLKKRFCHSSNEDLCLIPNTRTKNHIKKRIERPPQNERHRKAAKNTGDSYQELLMLRLDDPQLLKALLEIIWRYNMEDGNEVFMVFFPRILERVAAAIKIQQSFRSYRIRKQQKMQINPGQVIFPNNEYWFARAVIQNRAALCISQWWKNLKLCRRLEALSSIKKYVSSIKQSTLYLEESIYMNLGMILTQQSKSLRFIEQNLKFDFKHPSDAETQNINAGIIPNQESFQLIMDKYSQSKEREQSLDNQKPQTSQTNLIGDNKTWHLVFSNTTTDTFRFKHFAIPNWIWKSVEDFNRYRLNENQISVFFNNFMGVVHRSSFDLMCEVKDFNEIIDPKHKTMNLNLGLNFISINCMTVAEAKKRALLVGILSYNLKRRSFIRMFTQSNLGDGMCIKSIYEIWRQYHINDADARMAALINNSATLNAAERQYQMESIKLVRGLKEKQRVQEHAGYIVNEQGRWEQGESEKIVWAKVETKKALESSRINKSQSVDIKPSFAYVQIKEPPTRVGIVSQEMNLDDTQLEGNNWTAQYLQRLQTHQLDQSYSTQGGVSHLIGKIGYHPPPTTAPLGALKPNKVQLQSINSNRNIAPGFYYHTSSKEPIASVRNIGNESPIKDQIKSTANGIRAIKQMDPRNQTTSGERTTKAGTAWPSTRQGAGSPNNDYQQAPPTTAGSIVMYKSMNKSSNLTSALPSAPISPHRNQTAAVGYQRRITGLPTTQGMTLSQSFGLPSRPGVGASQRFSQSDIVLMAGEDQNLWILKKQREQQIESRYYQRELHQKDLDEKKLDIAKSRHVSEVMKHVLKVEQEQNLKMYQQFNREEKELVRELRNKDNERYQVENMVAKQTVKAHVENKNRKSDEKAFTNNFAQIRNLITKQTKAGEMIKHRTNALKRNKANAQMIKQQEDDFIARKHQAVVENKSMSNAALLNNSNKQAINSTLFDPCEIQEITFLQRQGIQSAAGSPRAAQGIKPNGSSRKIIKLKKDANPSMNDSIQGAANNKTSIFASDDNRRLMSQDNIRGGIMEYVPNHNQNQFAEISAKMNHRRLPSQYMSNAFSQPPKTAGSLGIAQSATGIAYPAVLPPGSRQVQHQRMTFIEEKFPLNLNFSSSQPHPQTQGGLRHNRYEQL